MHAVGTTARWQYRHWDHCVCYVTNDLNGSHLWLASLVGQPRVVWLRLWKIIGWLVEFNLDLGLNEHTDKIFDIL